MNRHIAQHIEVPRLIKLDEFGNHVGNALPPEAPAVFHLAAEYSESPTFNDLLARLPDTDSLVDNPEFGYEFMLRAAHRSRGLGDFEQSEAFLAQAQAFTRGMERPLQDFSSFDVANERAGLLAQAGDPLKAERTLQAALAKLEKLGKDIRKTGTQLTGEEHTAVEYRQYKGYLTLAALQSRQGRFAKAAKTARRSMGVHAFERGMLASQAQVESELVPALDALYGERGNNGQGLTPEEEEALWQPVEKATGDPTFRIERPLTPEEREKYSYLYDPSYLPDVEEVYEALAHDRTLELIHRFYRSGMPGERYELLTREYIAMLGRDMVRLAASRPDSEAPLRVLEVGAGEGRLAAFVQQRLEQEGQAAEVFAADLNADNLDTVFDVEPRDYREALAAHRPHLVLSSWMPLGKDWTPDFRASPDLEGYVMIGSPDICATPSAWASAPGFETQELDDADWFKRVSHPHGVEMDIARLTVAFSRS